MRSEDSVIVTGSRIAGPMTSITNNQHAAVDEGDVVKRIGDHLIVLQDGRLFAAAIREDGEATLSFADRIDVYDDPGIDTWYDEMLVFGRRILVTGYSYDRAAAVYEIVRLDEDGRFEHEARYLLEGNDYYSGENYASRIVGNRFVTYMRFDFWLFRNSELSPLPIIRNENESANRSSHPSYADIYMPLQHIEEPTIYMISVCDLSRVELEGFDCETTSVVAGNHAEFYVTETDAYLWTARSDWDIANEFAARSPFELGLEARRSDLTHPVYRLNFATGELAVARVEGTPPNQLAIDGTDADFRALTIVEYPIQDEETGRIRDEFRVGYLSFDLSEFDREFRPVPLAAYTRLPDVEHGYPYLETRFVGDWLVYGEVDSWSPPQDDDEPLNGSVIFVPTSVPAEFIRLPLGFSPLRVDQVDGHPVVTGYRDQAGLRVGWFDLDPLPSLVSSALLDDRYESENRSHAFNGIGVEDSAILGIPTVRRPEDAGRWWWESDASDLSFLTFTESAGLADAGEIAGSENNVAPDYACEVSCIDWYGNSRPIFTDGRIFALSGAEIAEAELVDGQIREIRRVNLTGATVR
ncbi:MULTISPECIES: beta-propeller domain-containing protein [Hyphobacterium]|uniref:Beta-propeller domain-containing protein n=1 Tax=Hyphobacterium vulgare TaxID=1736751 RepID=A0ABV6ZT31_9PROT